jgi:hypothetical protein
MEIDAMTRQPPAQSNGLPVDSHRLEELGKQAAQLFGSAPVSLTDAVVQTVGHIKLNAEQIRRVVEFANIEAFNSKFSSADPSFRYVSFDDGPADPAAVLQSLERQAPTTKTAEALDYLLPPRMSENDAWDDSPMSDRTRGGVIHDVTNLQNKLAAAHEELTQSIEAAKARTEIGLEKLSTLLRSARAGGAPEAVVFGGWEQRHPKLAAAVFTRLTGSAPPEAVKVAGRSLNPQHPLMQTFFDLASEAESIETLKVARADVEAEICRVGAWLRENGGTQ